MERSIERNDAFITEMLEHYGVENIPNPEHYPIRFEFLVKSFEHHLRMKFHNNA